MLEVYLHTKAEVSPTSNQNPLIYCMLLLIKDVSVGQYALLIRRGKFDWLFNIDL